LAQRGALETFDPQELKHFHPALVNALKYEDKIFGVPYYATSSTVLYNKKVFDSCTKNAGQQVPSSYDQLLELAPDLKMCKEARESVFTLNLNENDTFARILTKYDVADFTSPDAFSRAKKVYDIFKTMYDKGYMPPDALTINHREVVEKYMSNNTVFVVVGANFINMVEENALNVYNNSAVSPQLTGSNGKYDVALMNFVIPKKAKNKELAREFLMRLSSKENQLEFAKLTNVLPASLFALEDDYFNICDSNDLMAQARCISKKQLNSLIDVGFGYKNKKAINDVLNRSLEDYILQNSGMNTIKAAGYEVSNLQN
jgi:putative chitobiose transport system substrate-binding protein